MNPVTTFIKRDSQAKIANANAVHAPLLNAFTVDVEDYYQVSAFEDRISHDDWHDYPSRVVNNTQRLLDLLDLHETTATFFILGWTARHYPYLVREIHDRGHELGSHSYWHQLIYTQTPKEFRGDLRESLKAIEDASGERVTCYRAPSFSITKRSEWALEILVEEGIEIDSSIYPIHHDRYGMPDSTPEIHLRRTKSGTILEFPPAILQTFFGNLPISGGGYFRLYPRRVTHTGIKSLHRKRRPYMFYVHPWEIDPHQPRLPSSSRLKTWRHRVNLRSTYSKLEHLLASHEFGTITAAIKDAHFRSNVLGHQDASALPDEWPQVN